ncbi:unnamed protein product [Rhizophagus irregularis]|nr:unnamed protein product [Rhizophagus irregularis]
MSQVQSHLVTKQYATMPSEETETDIEAVIHFQTNSKAQQVNESALQNQQNSTNNERTLPEVEMKSNRAKKMDAVSNQQFPILLPTLEASNNTLNQATKKYQQRNNIKHSCSNIICEQ